jgi:hypothetical protein
VKIKIKMIPNSIVQENTFTYCLGEIFIGDDFWETIAPALDYWTIADYKRQWQEGLERIKTHDTSCLVASVQNPYLAPLINWWPLYKKGDKIFIQNELIVSEDYKKYIGDNIFSPETCYNFIQPFITQDDDGTLFSTWEVDVDPEFAEH